MMRITDFRRLRAAIFEYASRCMLLFCDSWGFFSVASVVLRDLDGPSNAVCASSQALLNFGVR